MLDPRTAMRQKLLVVLDDLSRAGGRDPDAMWFTGKFADAIAGQFGVGTWIETRRPITRQDYEQVLRACDTAIAEHVRAGREKHAYAIQMVATAWAARSHDDAEIAAGARLLDEVIDNAIIFYRANPIPAQPGSSSA
jgi:hypothetical protein